MALIAIDITETREYISEYDPEKNNKEKATVFELGVLSYRVESLIKDKYQYFTQEKESGDYRLGANINARAKDIVRFGLKGVKNFVDSNGKEVRFDTKSESLGGVNYSVVTDGFLDKLGAKVVLELSEAILNENKLSEEGLKNSELQSIPEA